MPAPHDLFGRRFGRLLVITRAAERVAGHVAWHVLCDCGKEKICAGRYLLSGKTRSCGCLRSELLVARMRPLSTVHGQTNTRTWRIWREMLRRCEDRKSASYKNYGAKGVSVCERWHAFHLFFADMGVCPDKYTLDRIENSKGYEPGNCRWATTKEQARNTTRNIFLTHKGKTQCMTDWAAEVGLPVPTLRGRIFSGWPVDTALTARLSQGINPLTCKAVTAFGRTQTVTAWAREIGMARTTLRQRLARMPAEQAISKGAK